TADFPSALETLASPRVEEPRRKAAAETTRTNTNPNAVPEWWQGQDGRVDAAGVARRRESWLVRSRFAIACTVACLALIAAVVMGTVRRGPAGGSPWGQAMAGTRTAGHSSTGAEAEDASSGSESKGHKKASTGKRSHTSGDA